MRAISSAYNGSILPSFGGVQMNPDFLLYDRMRQLLLVCEVKTTRNENARWAAEYRHNLLANELVPNAPYFLMVLSTFSYLWKDASPNSSGPPDYEGSTYELLQPFLPSWYRSTDDLSEGALELAVASLLDNFTDPQQHKSCSRDAKRLLYWSGLAERAQEGSLVDGALE